MSLNELLEKRRIYRIEPDPDRTAATLEKAEKDITTAITLTNAGEDDWALAIAYNAMLSAGRAHMFNSGYRPPSLEGHLAVQQYLKAVSPRKTT